MKVLFEHPHDKKRIFMIDESDTMIYITSELSETAAIKREDFHLLLDNILQSAKNNYQNSLIRINTEKK